MSDIVSIALMAVRMMVGDDASPVENAKDQLYGLTFKDWLTVEGSYCPASRVGVVRASKYFPTKWGVFGPELRTQFDPGKPGTVGMAVYYIPK